MASTCSVVTLLSVAGCLSLLATGQVTTEDCTNKVGGISINGKCFFVKTEASSWSSAWTKCEADGATLAQVHATNEFEAIKAMLEKKGRDPNASGFIRAWIGLQRDEESSGNCAVPPTTTFWYDGPTTKNTNMPAGDTWMRSRKCDDEYDTGGEYFMALMMNDDEWIGVADLQAAGDETHPSYPLCQISMCNRGYSINTNGKCIDETAVETTSVGAFQDCADACSNRSWCRSFDVIKSKSQCNLFTWISSDTVKPKMKNGNGDCVHYDTDP